MLLGYNPSSYPPFESCLGAQPTAAQPAAEDHLEFWISNCSFEGRCNPCA